LRFWHAWRERLVRPDQRERQKVEVPVHSKAKEAGDLWLERSHLASNPSASLFPSFGKNRETIESRRLDRRSVLKLVEKRARTSGILKRVCCHSFRATGVTEYMNSGGTIEIAQRIAGHTSPSTTRIYDRSGDRLTLEEIERVQIGKKRPDLNSVPRAVLHGVSFTHGVDGALSEMFFAEGHNLGVINQLRRTVKDGIQFLGELRIH
jgi:integrase